MRIFDSNSSGLHAFDSPGMGSQEKNISCEAFNCKILVEGSYRLGLRFHDDRVIRVLRNRTARGYGSKTRAAPALHATVYLIPVEQSAASPTRGRDAFRKHLDHIIEIVPGKIAVGIGRAKERIKIVFFPWTGRSSCNDLLGQDIERVFRDLNPFELTFSNGRNDSGAFDEFVAGGRENASLWFRADPVSGSPDTL